VAAKTRAEALLGLKPAATKHVGIDDNPFDGHSPQERARLRGLAAAGRASPCRLVGARRQMQLPESCGTSVINGRAFNQNHLKCI
jgi:hypothetical protein